MSSRRTNRTWVYPHCCHVSNLKPVTSQYGASDCFCLSLVWEEGGKEFSFLPLLNAKPLLVRRKTQSQNGWCSMNDMIGVTIGNAFSSVRRSILDLTWWCITVVDFGANFNRSSLSVLCKIRWIESVISIVGIRQMIPDVYDELPLTRIFFLLWMESHAVPSGGVTGKAVLRICCLQDRTQSRVRVALLVIRFVSCARVTKLNDRGATASERIQVLIRRAMNVHRGTHGRQREQGELIFLSHACSCSCYTDLFPRKQITGYQQESN